MTELIINGKPTAPFKHTIVGCIILGVEQIGNDITKLILKDCVPNN
jgi:hypothetical protein